MAVLFHYMVLLVGLNPDLEGTSSKSEINLESIPGQSLAYLLRPTNANINRNKYKPIKSWTSTILVKHSTNDNKPVRS